jgi:hypothetical protein
MQYKEADGRLQWLIRSRQALSALWQMTKEQRFAPSSQRLLEIPSGGVETGQYRPSAYPLVTSTFMTFPAPSAQLKQSRYVTED